VRRKNCLSLRYSAMIYLSDRGSDYLNFLGGIYEEPR